MQVATKDIKVQKILALDNQRLISPCFGSIIWDEHINEVLESKLGFPDENCHNSIYLGFHSAKEIELDGSNCWKSKNEYIIFYRANHRLYEFIIPKGARYYVNEDDVYVSNKIIFTGNVLDK